MLCAKFSLNQSSGSGKKVKNVKKKSLQRQQRKTTEKFGPAKLRWALNTSETLTLSDRIIFGD